MAIRLNIEKVNNEKKEYIAYMQQMLAEPSSLNNNFPYRNYYINDSEVILIRKQVALILSQRKIIQDIKQADEYGENKRKKDIKTKQSKVSKCLTPKKRRLSPLSFTEIKIEEQIFPNYPSVKKQNICLKFVGRVNNLVKRVMEMSNVEDVNDIYKKVIISVH